MTGADAIWWERTADRSVWAAAAPGGVTLTVTRTSGAGWLPAVAEVSGPEHRTRLEAQAWCERQAAS
jgi:hypothetical protein